MNLKELLAEMDKFIGNSELGEKEGQSATVDGFCEDFVEGKPEEGVKEGQEFEAPANEGTIKIEKEKDADKADMKKDHSKEVKAVEKEIDCKDLLRRFAKLESVEIEKADYKKIKPEPVEVAELKEDFDVLKGDAQFRYMMLSRLEQDCKYFLGNGNGHEPHLWAGNVEDHIKLMRDLYNTFADDTKPEWITLEDIDNYEKEMLAKKAEKAAEKNEAYGDKRDYRKIDIYVDGDYACSTTWAKTCKEAVDHYKENNCHSIGDKKVIARFAKNESVNEATEAEREGVINKFLAYMNICLGGVKVDYNHENILNDLTKYVKSEDVFFHQLATYQDPSYGNIAENPNFQEPRRRAKAIGHDEVIMTPEEDAYFWNLNDARHLTLAKEVAKKLIKEKVTEAYEDNAVTTDETPKEDVEGYIFKYMNGFGWTCADLGLGSGDEVFNSYTAARDDMKAALVDADVEEIKITKFDKPIDNGCGSEDIAEVTGVLVKSLKEAKITEISHELADAANTQRQLDSIKKTIEWKKTGKEIDREIAKEAKDKATKSNKLFARWKELKNIEENKNESVGKVQKELIDTANKLNNVNEEAKPFTAKQYNVVKGNRETVTEYATNTLAEMKKIFKELQEKVKKVEIFKDGKLILVGKQEIPEGEKRIKMVYEKQ